MNSRCLRRSPALLLALLPILYGELSCGRSGPGVGGATAPSNASVVPDQASTALADSGLAAAQRQIAQREYRASANSGGLQAPNREHNLRTYFAPMGIRVHDRTRADSPELLALDLVGVGRGETPARVEPGKVTSDGARVEIERPGLVEWYENSPAGLEQGFTLQERPAGEGPLVVELLARGARASLRGQRVSFATPTGRQLSYAKLAALDARGHALESHFELLEGSRLQLVVDDDEAVYPVVIDPLLTATADTQLESNQVSASLGISVAGAGDVNGDGYADVIVGASGYDAGESDEGAAFVFLGSAEGIADGSPATAATQLESNQSGARLGTSVAGAGDVNGDGYADVIVGAYLYDADPGVASQEDEGAAFVFLGSAAGIADGDPSSAAAQLESDQKDASMGNSVAGAGDVNGDGYADVIVGARKYEVGDSPASVIVALLDGNPFEDLATVICDADDWSIMRGNDDGTFQNAVAFPVGDCPVSVAVGQLNPTRDNIVPIPDLVTANFLSDDVSIVIGDEAKPFFQPSFPFPVGDGPRSVAVADLDGDTFADIVTANQNSDDVSVLLARGTGIFDPAPFPAAGDGPASVAVADFDGDTIPDLVTANQNSDDVSVLLGNGDGTFQPALPFAAGDGPSSVAVADFDLDTIPDLVTANQDSDDVSVLLGNGNGTFQAAASFEAGEEPLSVAVGDFNADTAIDLVNANLTSKNVSVELGNGDGSFGLPAFFPANQTNEGAAFVFLGGASGIVASGNPENADATLQSNQTEAWLGWSVAGAGNVNGDGYDDVIAGAMLYDSPATDEGAAFVFLGSAAGIANGDPSTAAAELEANQTAAFMGSSVAGAGDVNDDGYDDVIVGAYRYQDPAGGQLSLADEGAAFVFLGSAAGIPDGNPSTAATQLESNQRRAYLGASVAGAGDVNDDGYDDVIVGAYRYNAEEIAQGEAETDEGAAFVFFGSGAGIPDSDPSTAAIQLETDQLNAWLGFSVAGAGDVNNDGAVDVIVGAPSFDAPSSGEGAAFVYLAEPVSPAPAPEPALIAGLAAGVACLAILARRRRRLDRVI